MHFCLTVFREPDLEETYNGSNLLYILGIVGDFVIGPFIEPLLGTIIAADSDLAQKVEAS